MKKILMSVSVLSAFWPFEKTSCAEDRSAQHQFDAVPVPAIRQETWQDQTIARGQAFNAAEEAAKEAEQKHATIKSQLWRTTSREKRQRRDTIEGNFFALSAKVDRLNLEIGLAEIWRKDYARLREYLDLQLRIVIEDLDEAAERGIPPEVRAAWEAQRAKLLEQIALVNAADKEVADLRVEISQRAEAEIEAARQELGEAETKYAPIREQQQREKAERQRAWNEEMKAMRERAAQHERESAPISMAQRPAPTRVPSRMPSSIPSFEEQASRPTRMPSEVQWGLPSRAPSEVRWSTPSEEPALAPSPLSATVKDPLENRRFPYGPFPMTWCGSGSQNRGQASLPDITSIGDLWDVSAFDHCRGRLSSILGARAPQWETQFPSWNELSFVLGLFPRKLGAALKCLPVEAAEFVLSNCVGEFIDIDAIEKHVGENIPLFFPPTLRDAAQALIEMGLMTIQPEQQAFSLLPKIHFKDRTGGFVLPTTAFRGYDVAGWPTPCGLGYMYRAVLSEIGFKGNFGDFVAFPRRYNDFVDMLSRRVEQQFTMAKQEPISARGYVDVLGMVDSAAAIAPLVALSEAGLDVEAFECKADGEPSKQFIKVGVAIGVCQDAKVRSQLIRACNQRQLNVLKEHQHALDYYMGTWTRKIQDQIQRGVQVSLPDLESGYAVAANRAELFSIDEMAELLCCGIEGRGTEDVILEALFRCVRASVSPIETSSVDGGATSGILQLIKTTDIGELTGMLEACRTGAEKGTFPHGFYDVLLLADTDATRTTPEMLGGHFSSICDRSRKFSQLSHLLARHPEIALSVRCIAASLLRQVEPYEALDTVPQPIAELIRHGDNLARVAGILLQGLHHCDSGQIEAIFNIFSDCLSEEMRLNPTDFKSLRFTHLMSFCCKHISDVLIANTFRFPGATEPAMMFHKCLLALHGLYGVCSSGVGTGLDSAILDRYWETSRKDLLQKLLADDRTSAIVKKSCYSSYKDIRAIAEVALSPEAYVEELIKPEHAGLVTLLVTKWSKPVPDGWDRRDELKRQIVADMLLDFGLLRPTA